MPMARGRAQAAQQAADEVGLAALRGGWNGAAELSARSLVRSYIAESRREGVGAIGVAYSTATRYCVLMSPSGAATAMMLGVTPQADASVLWRALPVARTVLLGYALIVNAVHADDYRRAGLAWAVLTVLALWTVAAPWVYTRPAHGGRPPSGWRSRWPSARCWSRRRRRGRSSAGGLPSVPSFWLAAPVLAAAVQWEWRGGLLAGRGRGRRGHRGRREYQLTRTESAPAPPPTSSCCVVAGLIVGYAAALMRDERGGAGASGGGPGGDRGAGAAGAGGARRRAAGAGLGAAPRDRDRGRGRGAGGGRRRAGGRPARVDRRRRAPR